MSERTPAPVELAAFREWLHRFYDMVPGSGQIALLCLRIAQARLKGRASVDSNATCAKLVTNLRQLLSSRTHTKGLVSSPAMWAPNEPLLALGPGERGGSSPPSSEVDFETLIRKAAAVLLEATCSTGVAAPHFVLSCAITLLTAACMQSATNPGLVLRDTSQLGVLAGRAVVALDAGPGPVSCAVRAAGDHLGVTTAVNIAILLHGWRALTEQLPLEGVVMGLVQVVDTTWASVTRTDPRKRPFLTVVAVLRTVVSWTVANPGVTRVEAAVHNAVAQILLQVHYDPDAEEAQRVVTNVVLSALGLNLCLQVWTRAAPVSDPRSALWLGARILATAFAKTHLESQSGHVARECLTNAGLSVVETLLGLVVRQPDPRAVALADNVAAKAVLRLPCEQYAVVHALRAVHADLTRLGASKCLEALKVLEGPSEPLCVGPEEPSYVKDLTGVAVVGSVNPEDALYVGRFSSTERTLKRLRTV